MPNDCRSRTSLTPTGSAFTASTDVGKLTLADVVRPLTVGFSATDSPHRRWLARRSASRRDRAQ